MFYNGAEGVAVSNHDNSLTVEDLRANLVVPVRKHTVDGDFKGLCCWKNIKREASIARVEFRVSLIIKRELRRRNIKAASPQLHFFLSMLSSSFSLVESLECTIVTFVKSPMLIYWNVMAAKFSCNRVISHNGAGKDRSMSKVKLISILLEELASMNCFLDTVLSK
jgi:hypothetical protein